ncbi:hypothetical protein B296_00041248 [Ensete ventricosum]|uniref:Uncharacterized protein n=1 Tax=Ensete ventricosum TaxID=4639 RepID=A0A426X0B4_ENSVE|nr:hypothetical protein B296_00041248 [Ensete ventricosum]
MGAFTAMMPSISILALPDRNEVFEIGADKTGVEIGTTLLQASRHLIRTKALPTFHTMLLIYKGILITTKFEVWHNTGQQYNGEMKTYLLFAYDTAKKALTPKDGEQPILPIPPSLVAGAVAGVSSTLCTYPLELLKTRLTIQEGPSELYRGLTPSLIGVVPYAATNYFAYDTLKKLYKKTFNTDDIGNVATLMIGSAAGAISSSATFPLEVARKHMQVGAVGGRQVYKNMLHALLSILEKEGVGGLYKGLGPSCMKLVPAAGISFMCYEACKKILIDEEDA